MILKYFFSSVDDGTKDSNPLYSLIFGISFLPVLMKPLELSSRKDNNSLMSPTVMCQMGSYINQINQIINQQTDANITVIDQIQ